MLAIVSKAGWEIIPNPFQPPKANHYTTKLRVNSTHGCRPKDISMTQVGVVRYVQDRGTYCFIHEIPGESLPRFAHIRDFFQPEMMREGQRVKFTPNNVPQPGRKYLGAINVEAA